MTRPMVKDNAMYKLLERGSIREFNNRKSELDDEDLTLADFEDFNLRGIDADEVNFSDSYFRQADLRGIDFSTADLHGASLFGAKISGALFPSDLPATEILLSLEHGTRLRY